MMIRENNFFTQRLRRIVLIGLTGALLALAGCGKKGPLYLPKESSAVGPYIPAICPGPPQSAGS